MAATSAHPARAETLCYHVGQKVLRKYGKELTKEAARVGVGKRPLECWAAIASELGIDAPAQELVDASEPELQERCAVTIADDWSYRPHKELVAVGNVSDDRTACDTAPH